MLHTWLFSSVLFPNQTHLTSMYTMTHMKNFVNIIKQLKNVLIN